MKLRKIFKKLLLPACAALLTCGAAQAAVDEFGKPIVYVSSPITGNETWYETNSYYLRTIVYVETNATLVIEPGTVVKGVSDTNNIMATTDIPNLVSGLWVARGGKLYATGTVTKPIIFTFDGDDLTKANDVGTNVSGMWGGIVLLGNATINSAANATGNAATPKFEVFEGTTGGTGNTRHIFGGDNDADSSGALRYVSIRYPGSKFEPAKELNGLTMGGCGYNTTVEYVEVLNSQDDGFEWWGGVMNTKHLVAAFCEDDDFDTDQGYRGTNQFWFGIKPTWNLTSSTDSRGFETDGELNDSVNATFKAPASSWVVYNATLIGRGYGDTTAGGGRSWNARDETMAKVYNTVFTAFSQGLLVDSDETATYFGDGRATMQNSIMDVSSNVYSANVSAVLSGETYTNSAVPALLKGISYSANGGLDPRPQAGSPALSDVLPGAPVAVTYRGAFGPTDTWADGWTALSQVGYLNTNTVVNPPVAPSIASSYSARELTFSLTSQTGYDYTLQSTPQLSPPAWTNHVTLPGNDQVITFPPVATTNAAEFFRILAE